MPNSWILIADDDDDFREIFQQLLVEEGRRVVTAQTGRQVMGILERDGPPTALILDMMMPGLDEFEVLERMCLPNCRTEVVILSALSTPIQRERFERVGVRAVLSKPLALGDLLQHL